MTEKGYCLTPSTGRTRARQPSAWRGSRWRLSAAHTPGFARARARSAPANREAPLTLISCDNVPSNGARLGAAMLKFAAMRSAELTRWIEERVTFPSTMVDRIVPATSPDDLDKVSEALDAHDQAAVVGEPFRQWVIEDKFAGERPPLDLAGATFVADAKPYEQIKMRVLNAAQSTLAHQGALVGHELTHQAAADPVLAALTRTMLEQETWTTLPKLTGMEIGPYIDQSMARIRNTAIRHRCHQIGTDGSQKIVQRLVDPLRERLATRPAGGLAHALGRQLDRLWFERGAPLRRALGAVRPLRGERHRDWRNELRLARAGPGHALHRADLWHRHGATAPH